MTSFQSDLCEIARSEFEKGRLSRRAFLQVCGWTGAMLTGARTLAPKAAEAAANEIVFVNFGGDAVRLMREAWVEPFTSETSIKVVIDGAGPDPGKIKAMVQSGRVVWDLCSGEGYLGDQLGKQGLLEEIDYSVVDKNMVRPGWTWKYSVANVTYSYVLAYDRGVFPSAPPTLADFFDTKRIPGKRTMPKRQMGSMELCLIADGVPKDKIYPADVRRAVAKAKTLGNDLAFWNSGAESQQMFLDREVVMGIIWNTRASVLERDTQGRVTYTWNDGLFCPGAVVIPKGNPAGKLVNRFIAGMLVPERQIKLLETLGNGPSNPAASAMLPPHLRRKDPGFADNVKVQLVRDESWYAENLESALETWLDGISS